MDAENLGKELFYEYYIVYFLFKIHVPLITDNYPKISIHLTQLFHTILLSGVLLLLFPYFSAIMIILELCCCHSFPNLTRSVS